MSVETDVAAHRVRLDGHDALHARHAAEFDKVWAQIEASRLAREDTNTQIGALNVTQSAMSEKLNSLDAFIRGDLRTAFIGGVAAIVVLAAVVVLVLTGDVGTVHDAAVNALPGAP